jgi:C4-dicarboxylate-specific signal transduction histidine kinase
MMNSLTPIASLAQSVRPLLADPTAAAMTDVAAAIDVIADRSAGLMSFVERYRQVADLPRPVFRQVKLASVIAAVGQLLEPMLARGGVAYSSRVEPADLVVWADPAMVEQALINLLRNAMDALAGQPAPQVEVDCRLEGEQVVITVADNGAGVDPALLDRIFVPFFTTKPGGSGVGLSLVRQIALAHGGQIEALRGPSGGMLFRWRFASEAEPGRLFPATLEDAGAGRHISS